MLSLLNPIVAMLYNEKLARWHPILFVESPLPGGARPTRHKSKGHHTVGFATRAKAVESATNDIAAKLEGGARMELESDLPWDGEGVPAMVEFFGERVEGTMNAPTPPTMKEPRP